METFMVDRSKKWTVEDYLQLEEDVKCEILDGELLMTPAPLISHQRTLASLYQQLVFSNKLFSRIYVTQRFRYEQRFVQQQDFRTRWRHFFAVNIPLNQNELMPSAFYLSMYNELFINGERSIGDDRKVELFDRNRFYMALGYQLTEKLKFQAGMMRQLTDVVGKNQLQIGIHTTL